VNIRMLSLVFFFVRRLDGLNERVNSTISSKLGDSVICNCYLSQYSTVLISFRYSTHITMDFLTQEATEYQIYSIDLSNFLPVNDLASIMQFLSVSYVKSFSTDLEF